MTEPSIFFDDAAAYEAFMGRWTRSAGALFLNWIAPPKNSRWLDIGCGTGVFTDNAFDVVVSALVINFIPDRPKALAEMRRVGRAGGAVRQFRRSLARADAALWPKGKGRGGAV